MPVAPCLYHLPGAQHREVPIARSVSLPRCGVYTLQTHCRGPSARLTSNRIPRCSMPAQSIQWNKGSDLDCLFSFCSWHPDAAWEPSTSSARASSDEGMSGWIDGGLIVGRHLAAGTPSPFKRAQGQADACSAFQPWRCRSVGSTSCWRRTDRYVLLVEAVGELLDRAGSPVAIALGGGIVTIPGRGDDPDRSCARLLTGEHGAGPEAHATRSRPARYCTMYLFVARQHTQPEAGKVVVPDDD